MSFVGFVQIIRGFQFRLSFQLATDTSMSRINSLTIIGSPGDAGATKRWYFWGKWNYRLKVLCFEKTEDINKFRKKNTVSSCPFFLQLTFVVYFKCIDLSGASNKTSGTTKVTKLPQGSAKRHRGGAFSSSRNALSLAEHSWTSYKLCKTTITIRTAKQEKQQLQQLQKRRKSSRKSLSSRFSSVLFGGGKSRESTKMTRDATRPLASSARYVRPKQ